MVKSISAMDKDQKEFFTAIVGLVHLDSGYDM